MLPVIDRTDIDDEAVSHVNDRYSNNPGALDKLHYPTCHEEADRWLDVFLKERFGLFGDYEDAIVKGENSLWHGVLTPMLNIGLLTPDQVVGGLEAWGQAPVPIHWRIPAADHRLARIHESHVCRSWCRDEDRQSLGASRDLPSSYDATAGSISRRRHQSCSGDGVLRTSSDCVLGGFMFLCEIHPDQIYRWFMEMFVDSYDWVMVPNVYAMSQHADGGLITTKPYFSGSSYVKKMGNHPNGDWTKIWDGLYWRWIWNHSEELGKNPRWAIGSMARKMDESSGSRIWTREEFLSNL